MKLEFVQPWQYKRLQTEPHQRWSSKQVGDSICPLHLSLFPLHMHAQTDRGTYINRTEGKNLFMGSQWSHGNSHPCLYVNSFFSNFTETTEDLCHIMKPKSLFHTNSLSHFSWEQSNLWSYSRRCYLTGNHRSCYWYACNYYSFWALISFRLSSRLFSMSSVHQGLPGNADSVFIWNLVSSEQWVTIVVYSRRMLAHLSFLFYLDFTLLSFILFNWFRSLAHFDPPLLFLL